MGFFAGGSSHPATVKPEFIVIALFRAALISHAYVRGDPRALAQNKKGHGAISSGVLSDRGLPSPLCSTRLVAVGLELEVAHNCGTQKECLVICPGSAEAEQVISPAALKGFWVTWADNKFFNERILPQNSQGN